MNQDIEPGIQKLYENIRSILFEARRRAYQSVYYYMVHAHWHVGKLIVEEEQNGKERADYGAQIMKSIGKRLVDEFGKTYDERNLYYFRQFYTAFPNLNALRSELSWTHYRSLLRVKEEAARQWYMHEAANEQWGTRALDRQINVFYYERMLLSNDQTGVRTEAEEHTSSLSADVPEFVKDPYILEFLNLRPNPKLYEKDLEQAIIDHLQAFMLELGKGFAFVARQQCIRSDSREFYIDLVFYNYILKCFVLLDLKIGELAHQDIGQMDFYVRYYEDRKRTPDDNPTIGIILCSEKDETIVKYSILEESRTLFAARYLLYLPTEAELAALLKSEIAHFQLQASLSEDDKPENADPA